MLHGLDLQSVPVNALFNAFTNNVLTTDIGNVYSLGILAARQYIKLNRGNK